MENKTIDELLQSLTALVGDARGSLFGQDKVLVDREQLLYLVDALQQQLPAEINEAKTIVENSNALRNNAKQDAADIRREANQVLQDAQERAAKLIEETKIVAFAKERQQEILSEAEEQRAKLIAGAIQYADRILEDAQQTVANTMEALKSGFTVLQEQARNQLSASEKEIADTRKAMQSASTDA